MTVHAFVDESARNGLYLLGVTIVEPAQLAPTRKELTKLLLPGARELHFKKEKDPRRRLLADRISALNVRTRLYSAACTQKQQEDARQRCLGKASTDLLGLRARRLVLDSRSNRDAHDKRTLRHALGTRPASTDLTYEHVGSTSEPLLWISDAVAWCHGAGGHWRRRIAPIVGDLTVL